MTVPQIAEMRRTDLSRVRKVIHESTSRDAQPALTTGAGVPAGSRLISVSGSSVAGAGPDAQTIPPTRWSLPRPGASRWRGDRGLAGPPRHAPGARGGALRRRDRSAAGSAWGHSGDAVSISTAWTTPTSPRHLHHPTGRGRDTHRQPLGHNDDSRSPAVTGGMGVPIRVAPTMHELAGRPVVSPVVEWWLASGVTAERGLQSGCRRDAIRRLDHPCARACRTDRTGTGRHRVSVCPTP